MASLRSPTIGGATRYYDRATNARFRPDKPRDATSKPLIILNPWLTLNQLLCRDRGDRATLLA